MDVNQINLFISQFSKETHGSSNYDSDSLFVIGENTNEFAPLNFLKKKIAEIHDEKDLLKIGYIFGSFEFAENNHFKEWYERQFAKKLTIKTLKNACFLYRINHRVVFDALEKINKSYGLLIEQKIILNSKNFPIQLGEWYAKSIFGLRQVKSTSQRGFDFVLNGEKVEVKIHWKIHSGERPSPKGVKIKKSLIQLSKSCIILYLSKNFMIKEICFLDSDYILRKFVGKGHTIFLKDGEISPYFFSKSSKHYDKIVNPTALMTFSSPTLAMKLDGKLPSFSPLNTDTDTSISTQD